MSAYFTGEFEVWVKPWFRKARPKIVKVCWHADDYVDFLRFAAGDMGSRYKRWKLLNWYEEPISVATAERQEPLCEASGAAEK